MSQKLISQAQNAIPEENSSDNDSEALDEIEETDLKENDKIMIASLDLIDKKKKESYVHNLRLSLKDPMMDISNQEIMTETRTKIELLKKNRKEVEMQIEEKLAVLDKYESEIFKIIEEIEKEQGKTQNMEASIKITSDKNPEKASASDILKKKREEYQKKKAETAKENADTKSKLDELKKKFNKTEENKENKNRVLPEKKQESSPTKFDELQKELQKKLNNLNQKKEEEKTDIMTTSTTNKINLNEYRAQLKKKLNPQSEQNIPPPEPPPNMTESKKVHSKIADRVALLENLFQGKMPAPFPNTIKNPCEEGNLTESVVLDHVTYERARLPAKKNKKSKTVLFNKRVSKEW